jgi:hypothetical protein
MQTLQEFVPTWNGRGNNSDGAYGYQCVDIVNQYVQDVLGERAWGGNAIDKWTNFDASKFDRIVNTPSFVPQAGDIAIWGSLVGKYGHIAIFLDGGVNSFHSFDQNWPLGSLCHIQSHNYRGFLGVLRHKQSNAGFNAQVVTATLNIRSAADSTQKNVVGTANAGNVFTVLSVVEGTNVNGNSQWYCIGEGRYIAAYWTKRV